MGVRVLLGIVPSCSLIHIKGTGASGGHIFSLQLQLDHTPAYASVLTSSRARRPCGASNEIHSLVTKRISGQRYIAPLGEGDQVFGKMICSGWQIIQAGILFGLPIHRISVRRRRRHYRTPSRCLRWSYRKDIRFQLMNCASNQITRPHTAPV